VNSWHPQKTTLLCQISTQKKIKKRGKPNKEGKNTFHRMMRNMNLKKPELSKKPVHSLRSASARAAAALRNTNRERQNATSDKSKKGNWQKTTSIFINRMVDLVKKSVGFSENGKHERYCKWPAFAYPPVLQPSKDPVNFLGLIGDERHLNALTREDFFALPDLMIWAPELRWEHLCPSGRPCCPFHPGQTDCVQHNGYADSLIRNDRAVEKSRQDILVNDDITVDADLDTKIAKKVVDAMNDGTFDDDTQADSAANIILSSQILTESAAWVGKQLGVERGQGPVRRVSEKTFFQSN
jgi:hypothetical protein